MGIVPTLHLLAVLLLIQLDRLLAFVVTKDTPGAPVQPAVPPLLSRAAGKGVSPALDRVLHLSFPFSGGSS